MDGRTRSRLADLVDVLATYGILLLDRRGRVTYLNDGVERLTGRSDAITGEHVASLYAAESTPSDRIADLFARAEERGTAVETARWVSPDEASVPVEVGVTQLPGTDEYDPEYGMIVRETGAEVADGTSLPHSRYRTLVENLPNGAVALYDEDLRYVLVAGRGLEDIDHSPATMEGRLLEDVHSPSFVEQYLPRYRAVFEGERSQFTFTYDGRTYDAVTVPVRDGAGDVVAGLAMTQDVTERVEARRELERQNERLEEFTSVVSHDIRNPLSVAQGHLELLAEECDSDHVEGVRAAHERIESLVSDLLELARQGRAFADPEAVALSNAVDRAWANVAASDASVEVVGDGRLSADPDRLVELLENLFRNAVEHGSTGGKSNPDGAAERGDGVSITVGTLEGGFYVADDGRGVPEAEREHIFEPGYTTSDGGTGFGLGIVEAIAEAHGWDIGVTESASGGARFEVTGVESPPVE